MITGIIYFRSRKKDPKERIEVQKVSGGTVGKWIEKKLKIHLKKYTKLFHGNEYRIPHACLSTVKKELDRLVEV